jgi:membrane peptidoglycan carboxypeptidase
MGRTEGVARPKPRWRRRVRRFFHFTTVLVLSAILVPVAGAGIVFGSLLFLDLPATVPPPKPPEQREMSHVYDIEGNEIAIFREHDTELPLRKEDIPPVLKAAVVASEDRNFYRHQGVDVRGTFRALWADLQNRRYVQGGSTITQQYVKTAYTG